MGSTEIRFFNHLLAHQDFWVSGNSFTPLHCNPLLECCPVLPFSLRHRLWPRY